MKEHLAQHAGNVPNAAHGVGGLCYKGGFVAYIQFVDYKVCWDYLFPHLYLDQGEGGLPCCPLDSPSYSILKTGLTVAFLKSSGEYRHLSKIIESGHAMTLVRSFSA